LPSEPSSVTVIREADGRYYALFIVKREAVPSPASDICPEPETRGQMSPEATARDVAMRKAEARR
jgi:hypothetical protein